MNVRASVCRVAPSDLDRRVVPLERARWAHGDYVVGEVFDVGSLQRHVELESGRLVSPMVGDRVVGCLAVRFATLELTGSWEAIGDDLRFEAMTAAGVFGRVTSRSPFLGPQIGLQYVGHCVDDAGRSLRIGDQATPGPPARFGIPTVLVVGSSMSAGKTHACRMLVRRLKDRGLRVLAAKLTGCGRYRDVLTMADAGADFHFDFVDAGLSSTIGPPDEIRRRLAGLLARMAACPADVAVIEAGASPLEPYSGDVAVELLGDAVRLRVLAASDPYSVVGIQAAFDMPIDVVTGIATNTLAGVALVRRLTGLPAVPMTSPHDLGELDAMLEERFVRPV